MLLPQRLDSPVAHDIAKAMMDGFNRHYRLFRAESARAKHRFETADWHGQQRAQKERIEFYDLRVRECFKRLESEFNAGALPMDVWQQVKLLYIGMLVDHRQPELAESFFNSVTTKILHRSYFQNDFIFVRPAVSTEYIESADPARSSTYRAYYPRQDSVLADIRRMVLDFGLHVPFQDFERDTLCVYQALSPLFANQRLRYQPDGGGVIQAQPVDQRKRVGAPVRENQGVQRQGKAGHGGVNTRLTGVARQAFHP